MDFMQLVCFSLFLAVCSTILSLLATACFASVLLMRSGCVSYLFIRPSVFQTLVSYPITMRPALLDPAFFKRWCRILSLCVPRYLLDPAKHCWVLCHRFVLVIYLFIYLVCKLFFKMLLLLHLWTDSFDIACESSLEGSTFSLCSAWRFGDFWRFGDWFHFKKNNGLLYSETSN